MRLICTVLTLTLVSQLWAKSNDSSVIEELISRLSNLKGHAQIKSNLTVSDLMVPSPAMRKHAQCCVPEFKKLLRDMFKNVTVSAEHQDDTIMIINNLDKLHEKTCTHFNKCNATKMSNILHFEPFTQYTNYLKWLNTRRNSTRRV